MQFAGWHQTQLMLRQVVGHTSAVINSIWALGLHSHPHALPGNCDKTARYFLLTLLASLHV